MADDPRIETASTAMRSVQEQWLNGSLGWPGEPAHLAKARAGLAAADVVDPLRALLADEDRAVELIARAGFDNTYGASAWDGFTESFRHCRRGEALAVLAALREVAGL